MNAYLVVVGIALLGLIIWGKRFVRDPKKLGWLRVALGFYALVGLVIRIALWDHLDDGDSDAHNIAAISMFVFFGLAVLANVVARPQTTARFRWAYGVILGGMALAAVLLIWVIPEFDQTVFVLEAVEIGLFGLFWALQTWQFWEDEPTAGITAGQPA